MQNKQLIIFSRTAVLGKVKKRLAEEIGTEQALLIHQRLFAHTLTVAISSGIPYKVYFSSPPENRPGYPFGLQSGNDLGERMAKCFASELKQAESVCLIGSDCPELTPAVLQQGFELLKTNDVVIGPAHDGGYYLIGMKALHPQLFAGITWGTGKVLATTRQICELHNLSYYLLPTLNDVDRPADIPPGWL